MYRIESKIVEKLKEQDLNAPDLLQAHANIRKHEIKKAKEDVLRATKDLNKVIKTLEDNDIMTAVEIIQLLEDAGMIVERVEND